MSQQLLETSPLRSMSSNISNIWLLTTILLNENPKDSAFILNFDMFEVLFSGYLHVN